jgi:hydrophobe/amphiphile efflux-3 (HAE3) family protein
MNVQKFLGKVAEVEERRPKTVLLLFVIFTVFIFLGFTNINFDTDFENQVPQDIPEIEALNDIRDKLGGTTDSIILIYRSDFGDPEYAKDVRDRDVLKSIDLTLKQLEDEEIVIGTRSIAELVEIDSNQNEINAMLDANPSAQTMLSGDYTLTTATITVAGGLTTEQEDELLAKIENAIRYSDRPAGIDVDLAGSIVLSREIGSSIGRNIGFVTTLGFAGVIIILFLFFRRPGFVFIATLPIILGTIWTYGTLGLIGIPLSTQLTGVFSIILGLGIDFSIHIIHRFKEDREKYGIDKAIYSAVGNVGKGLTLTTTTTIIGFLALLAAVLPLLRDFAIALSLGVLFCLVAAIGVIPPLLVLVERRKVRKRRE